MKKSLSILCVIAIVAVLSSCTKQYVTPNNNQTVFFPVAASSWTQTSDGKSDSVAIKAPQIDSYFNNYGGVLAYFSYFNGVYEQIPEVYNGVAYSYIHYPGAIVLYAQPTNGGTPVKPTSPITLKLVLLSSN
jgi:hypothetical protein